MFQKSVQFQEALSWKTDPTWAQTYFETTLIIQDGDRHRKGETLFIDVGAVHERGELDTRRLEQVQIQSCCALSASALVETLRSFLV